MLNTVALVSCISQGDLRGSATQANAEGIVVRFGYPLYLLTIIGIWKALAQSSSTAGTPQGRRRHRRLAFAVLYRNGAPEEIRTPDPQIRSLVLYPAELRARFDRKSGVRALVRPNDGHS